MNSSLRFLGLLAIMALAGCARSTTETAALSPTIVGRSARDTVVLMGPATVLGTLPAAEPGRFDTGKMWTFENPPLDYFEATYGFRPSQEWLDRVRQAALRLPNCTASFVSPRGLVLTNHHCARESATAVSREGEDLLTDGFYAPALADERRVPDLYVDQLAAIRDVTREVQSAIDSTAPEEERVRARDAKIAELERQLSQELGLRCEITSLYHGGRYSSYCYRRYEDVRLVFVPEGAVGYFGGDPDNFTYPRYAYDVAFYRVYQDGQPLSTTTYLPWSDSGATPGEPVFVIGNPGSTSRLNTVAQLEYRRDHQYPFTLRLLGSRAEILRRYMEQHPEQKSRYINDYFSITNALKAYTGELEGLRNPNLMARKVAFERRFRDSVMADSNLARAYGNLWDEIADIRRQIAQVAPRLNALNQGGLLRSRTLELAATLVQYAQAASGGFAPESLLEQVRDELLGARIDPELDAQMLQAQIEDAIYLLGPNDPFLEQALAGRTPEVAAREIVRGSAMADSARRAELVLNPARVMASPDPAIRLMRSTLPRLQAAIQEYQRLTGAEELRTGKLAEALFKVYGTSIPPDATFTLRIADGVVQGYSYNGTEAPPYTTFYGMYDRHFSHRGREEWELPPRWKNPPREFDLGTPLNLVSTNDIIGGNSGSPLVNVRGEIVGVIFDGNIESLPGDFIYTTETARAISVHSAGILEALRDLYRAERLVSELLQARRN
jgi:hypothetical protein